MAETKTRARKTSKTATSAAQPAEVVAPAETTAAPNRKTRKTLSLDTVVRCVSSIPMGNLIYASKRMQGLILEWNEFGDEQYIDLAELQAMRNSCPSFFTRNWILIDDDEVLEFLRADKYYSCIKSIDDFDRILAMDASEIASCVPSLSKDLKYSLALITARKYHTGELDSLSKLKVLESATNIKIVDN